MLRQTRIPLQLEEKQYLTPNTMELCFRRPDGGTITYVPGQFFSFHLPQSSGDKTRSYSVANRTGDVRNNTELRIAATLVEEGIASEFFRQAQAGVDLEASGPYGNLILPAQDPQRYLLIATGAGVAPYRAMLPELEQRLQQNAELDVVLLLGVQTARELLYGEEFRDMARRHNNFHFIATYSRDYPEQPEVDEFEGYVQGHFDSLEPHPERDRIYLCGNPAMIDDSVTRLEPLGFTPANMKREKYLFSRL